MARKVNGFKDPRKLAK